MAETVTPSGENVPSHPNEGFGDGNVAAPSWVATGEDEGGPGDSGYTDNLSESKTSLMSNDADISALGTESDGDGIHILLQPHTSTPQVSIEHTRMAGHLKRAFSRSRSKVEEPNTHRATMPTDQIRVPLMGYEVMEERSKFTVFKVQVCVSDTNRWFVFRRFSDFLHLNQRLKKLFPGLRLALPPKRWFKDGFDMNFLEDRMLGLQAFADNITGHGDIRQSKPVREFFCLDEPPGPHDSLEDSKAHCEDLEDTVYSLKKEMVDKDAEIAILTEELRLYKRKVEMLSQALRDQNNSLESLVSTGSKSSSGSETIQSEGRDSASIDKKISRNGLTAALSKSSINKSDPVVTPT